MGSLVGSSDPKSRYYKSVLGASPMEYKVSKAALNMLMVEYWKKYGLHEGGRLRVYTADPGPNATNFMGHAADRARSMGIPGPEVGAKQLTACVLGERDGGEGKMWGVYGESPW
jgi:NAD(P)-dependent dehydrogenase (short-subunit alcohol dehydrogenase family)